MIPKFRIFVKAGTKEFFGGGYDTDQMFYEISEIDFYNKTVTVWGCHNKDCGSCDDTYKMEDVEIMMSTGLKDEGGIEIYEGDVVGNFREPAVVKKTHGGFVIVNARGVFNATLLHGDMKVLGNIYENPELLEVAE